jgi:DeoR/GlpR family transcriptional regulator of sugar metabolism
MASQSLTEARRNRLLELIRQRGFAPLSELAETLEVSESTIRRDLDVLEESGAAKRTHGGVYYTGPSPKRPNSNPQKPTKWKKNRRMPPGPPN